MIIYRAPIICPACHWKAALRAYPELVLFARGLDAETPLLSLRCQRKGCDQIYPVTAFDFQRATEDRPRASDKAA